MSTTPHHNFTTEYDHGDPTQTDQETDPIDTSQHPKDTLDDHLVTTYADIVNAGLKDSVDELRTEWPGSNGEVRTPRQPGETWRQFRERHTDSCQVRIANHPPVVGHGGTV